MILFKMHVLKQLLNLSNEEVESKVNDRLTFLLQHISLSAAIKRYIILTALIVPSDFHSKAILVNN